MSLVTNRINPTTGQPDPAQRELEGFVERQGHPDFYRIPSTSDMPPFLMTLASNSDVWAYISSAGALTAGRGNENRAIFPYETDDKLHRAYGLTGPITLMRVTVGDQKPLLWEPFAPTPSTAVTRALYKTSLGTRIVFEETHRALGLTFSYEWCVSDRFGLVRTCTLVNASQNHVHVELIDGLLNLLPAGVELSLQQQMGCLANAYTQCETIPGTTLGIFAMTSRIVDRAEPAESLRANVAWCLADVPVEVALSEQSVRAFRAGGALTPQSLLTGRRGSYLVGMNLVLLPDDSSTWRIVVDADRQQADVASLLDLMRNVQELQRILTFDCDRSEAGLAQLVAAADGQQETADAMVTSHHTSNVMFNVMRGGVCMKNHEIAIADLVVFIKSRQQALVATLQPLVSTLPPTVTVDRLLAVARKSRNPDFERLCFEYLPMMFSRRHGDPSRPWNRFNIRLRDKSGKNIIDYQGNWRDIFQNWEATLQSFPFFTESVIAKFVNASTADGHNPYRISRDGIDWEKPEPDHPWAHIGYWGDHQVVYLTRLLEASVARDPDALVQLLDRPVFSYADVPYVMTTYEKIVRDPQNTISFDLPRHHAIMARVATTGADGKLLPGRDGAGVYHVNLAEKLLVPVMAKLSNLVVDGGIWMNTQRPEWNDANNALVGNGLSVVTACYLRRHLQVMLHLFKRSECNSFEVSSEVSAWLVAILAHLVRAESILDAADVSHHDRRALLDALGTAYERYRTRVYHHGFAGLAALDRARILELLRVATRYLDHTIAANRRSDGMYHAYNLLRISADGESAAIGHLDEMLEGQVAALSSGCLSPAEVADVVDAMFASRLSRPDQKSFVLYPERRLPRFMEKNDIPASEIAGNPLLLTLISVGNDCIVTHDAARHYRFAADFTNAVALKAALDDLGRRPQWTEMVQLYGADVLAVYERLFQHARFTGRSGTMYGYEGIGCIYWHMVAKLQLAVAEAAHQAIAHKAPGELINRLVNLYYRVRGGLCFNKTAREYGAFPTDAYSHTPKHAGAQQPGMTGQVKEAILSRFAELGVKIRDGQVAFIPALLRRREFLEEVHNWGYVDVQGRHQVLTLPENSLVFTLCQTPVVYRLGDRAGVTFVTADGQSTSCEGNVLTPEQSLQLWARSGQVTAIYVDIPSTQISLD